jgi:hypothetical protein
MPSQYRSFRGRRPIAPTTGPDTKPTMTEN